MPSCKPATSPTDAVRLLTPEEVADLLSLTRDTVIKKAREGKMPSLKLGKAIRFRLATIEAWLREQECA
jgi:excisionase family DNA binding protein